MSTQFTNRQWRLPNNENKDKQSNYSMDFDNNFINIGNENYITSSNFNISISAWINIVTTSGDRTIVASGQSGSGAYDYRLNVDTNNNVYFKARTTPSSPHYTTITGGTTLSTNTWYHVCATWDMSNFNLYLNGVSDATSVSATTYFNDSGVKRLAIGYQLSSDVGGYRPFYGKIDAVSIFNYALSSSQITTLYGSSSTGIGNPMSLSPKPVAYYPLGDQDAFNGSNYLVPNSSLKDYVFDFDGNNDFVSTNFNVDNYTNLTYSVWVNPTSLNQRGGLASLSSVNNFVAAFWSGSGGIFFVYIGNVFSQITGIWSGSKFGTLGQEKWLHIAVVYDGSGATDADRLKVYADGDYVAFNSLGSIPASIPSGGGDLIIGKWTSALHNGSMSNVQIFNTSLPATGSNSIETLYNNGSPLTSMTGFTSLQGWWKLNASDTYDSSTGNWTIEDHAGSNDGTSSGMTQANLVQSDLSFTSGYSPYALSFDSASSDYIDTGTTLTGLGISTEFSVSLWFNSNNLTQYETIINAPTSAVSWSSGFGLQIVDSKLRFWINQWDNTSSFVNSNTLSTNTWYHALATFSNTSGIKLYVNAGTPTTNTQTTLDGLTNPINIGVSISSYFFNGKIDEVALWNTALTSTQVAEIYNGTSTNLTKDLTTVSGSNLIYFNRMGD